MTNSSRGPLGLRPPEIIGLILVGIGILFLFDTFRLITFSWGLVWPLLLVGAGIVVIASATRPGGGGHRSVRVERDGIDQLELELRLGAGRFIVQGGASGLVEVESNGPDIDLREDRSGRRARIRLAHDRPWFPFSESGPSDWRIAVGGDVATRLDVAAGAGDFGFDLSGIRIVDARVSVGAAQARITLPRPIGDVPVRIVTGASQVVIVTPPGVEMQVRASGGLFNLEGRNETAGYATATDRVSVRVEGGAASVRIE